MNFTEEEKRLLKRLENGEFNGMVGQEKDYTEGYRPIYCGKYIKNGVPISYRRGESTRFFNGKENERITGSRSEEIFDTDEKKIAFLQKYGFLISDDEVRSYSAKFKGGNK